MTAKPIRRGIMAGMPQETANALAERIYNLQKEQADAMMVEIKAHGDTLGKLVTDVAVIVDRTSDHAELRRRVEVIEKVDTKQLESRGVTLEKLDSRRGGIGVAAMVGVQAVWAVVVLLALHFWKS